MMVAFIALKAQPDKKRKKKKHSRLSNNNKHSPKFNRGEASGETDVHVSFSHYFLNIFFLWVGLITIDVIERFDF